LFAADIISCVEFNQDGELLATGDKGGRVVIFQVSQAQLNQIGKLYGLTFHKFFGTSFYKFATVFV
jgi:hypothetical protein